MEDFVALDLIDDAIEGVGVNANSPPVLTEVAGAPMFEEVELRRLLDRGVPL